MVSAVDSLMVLGISLATGVLSELISYRLIYSKPAYKDIKKKIERDSGKRKLFVDLRSNELLFRLSFQSLDNMMSWMYLL